jgi:hypothetical protein
MPPAAAVAHQPRLPVQNPVPPSAETPNRQGLKFKTRAACGGSCPTAKSPSSKPGPAFGGSYQPSRLQLNTDEDFELNLTVHTIPRDLANPKRVTLYAAGAAGFELGFLAV